MKEAVENKRKAYSGNVLQNPLGGLSLSSTTLSRNDNALVAFAKRETGGDTRGKGETIGNRRSQGKMSIPVRERPVGIIGNGEDVWGELKGLLSPVELDVLLRVDRNVLEWVHRHNHISNVSLKNKKKLKIKK